MTRMEFQYVDEGLLFKGKYFTLWPQTVDYIDKHNEPKKIVVSTEEFPGASRFEKGNLYLDDMPVSFVWTNEEVDSIVLCDEVIESFFPQSTILWVKVL